MPSFVTLTRRSRHAGMAGTAKILSAVAAFEHCDVLSGATVQPRQGRVKVARQELPGQQKVKDSPGSDGIARIFSRPCRDSVVLVIYPAVPAGYFLPHLPALFAKAGKD